MRVIFVIFLGLLCRVSSFEFEAVDQDGVKFGDKTSTAQQIEVDENNDGGRVPIVSITGVGDTLSMTGMTSNFDLLDAELKTDDNVNYQLIVNLLDYESLDSGGDSVLVAITEVSTPNTRQPLQVIIKNLDDEHPTLTVSNCILEEETVIDVNNSPCSFTISDPDGFLDTMDFSNIVGSKGEADKFAFAYKTQPAATDRESEIYLVLKDGQKLDYETTTLFTFNVEAQDNAHHPTTPASVPIIVQVQDMPDQPPVWDAAFRSAITIPEKNETTIQLSAKDGDYGINNNIKYTVEDENNFATVDASGLITVSPINRDEGFDQVNLTVTAIEVEQPDSTTVGTILLILEDIDDSIPEISVLDSAEKKIEITIDEGASDVPVDIVVTDLDLGANAIYNVTLEAENEDFLSAFNIIPGKGYEQTSLTLSIIDSKLLNYETADWIHITMTLHTQGTETPTNEDFLPITINLNDINDESPTFSEDGYSVEVLENVKAGYLLINITATDLDQEDIDNGLKHEILGAMGNTILQIEDLGGDVTTKIDKAFDYEKQNEIYVQIRAVDAGGHPASTQLTINVIDVNDENPRLVVSSTIAVEENQADNYPLETNIAASDEDSDANLEFSIDWSKSYATKNSQRIKDFENYHCINVETVPGDDLHTATAKLSLKETQPGNTPDYETFDTLYIQLTVTDKNTTEGDGTDSALIVINIQDVNDNKPIFADNTAELKREVTENTKDGIIITTVTATDADMDNNVTYAIKSADENTPDWVAIDAFGGVYVKLEGDDQIDCDDPKRDVLVYTVTASDGDPDHDNSINITIAITDQNDNVPVMEDQSEEIDEDNQLDPDDTLNGRTILNLTYSDADRDEPYNVVRCTFATSTSDEVIDRFTITDNTVVISLATGATLDREEYSEFQFELSCTDDPQHQGPVSNAISPPPRITIKLNDINDNKPQVTTTEITGITENTSKGPLGQKLQGKDDDEGDKGLITFAINKVLRYISDDDDAPTDVTDQFDITDEEDGKSATLSLLGDNLSGLWGRLEATIDVTDKGTPALNGQNVVKIDVAKYNFKEPIFDFPKQGDSYYFKTIQDKDAPLKLWNGGNMDNVKANDQQGNKYSIKFDVVEDSSDQNLFKVAYLGNSQGQLQLTNADFVPKPYTVTLRASLDVDNSPANGEASYEVNCTININFFDSDSTDPVFEHHSDTTLFTENSDTESYQVENATYPDIDLPDLAVYYLIREGDTTLFKIDQSTGTITLKQPLDYETQSSYEVLIQSSNADKLNLDALEETKFALTIQVVDQNDESPVFDQTEYFTTVLAGTSMSTKVTTVSATDKDTTSKDKLQYNIDNITPSNLDLDIKSAFTMNTQSGDITINFEVKDSMEGYFTLDLSVQDEEPENHKADATLKIYIVTSKNTVVFRFENDQETVSDKAGDIKSVLDEEFQYETKVEAPTGNTTDGTPLTRSPVFFLNLNTNEPVDATEILKKVTNVDVFQRLKNNFSKVGLVLLSFDSSSETNENLEAILKAWLIGVSVVLGALCLILLIAFILKTRALNQRIKKLSSTKFGSQESGLNRQGVAAPTTNKHAIEGSNPVYNNEVDPKDIDRTSVTSGDSDLIGVEDDEKFDFSYPTKDDQFE
jgi:hypothetical protein